MITLRSSMAASAARLAVAAARWRALAAGNLPDAMLLAGAASIAHGAWLVYPPAGWITAGVLLLTGGVIASRSAG